MIPDNVGPQKFPSANDAVNSPDTTACTSIDSGRPEITADFCAHPKLATNTAALPNPKNEKFVIHKSH